MKKVVIVVALIIILSAIFVSFFIFLINNHESQELSPNIVINVIDGDTFEIYNEQGNIETIRLLCVDTPEKNQTGYEEATDYLKTLILNKEVTLVSSVTDKDVYNRLLRYVYVNDSNNSLFVNQLILDNNYGELLIIPPETCAEMQ